jgi:hypothetical protein
MVAQVRRALNEEYLVRRCGADREEHRGEPIRPPRRAFRYGWIASRQTTVSAVSAPAMSRFTTTGS